MSAIQELGVLVRCVYTCIYMFLQSQHLGDKTEGPEVQDQSGLRNELKAS